jgi:hypothetical protein
MPPGHSKASPTPNSRPKAVEAWLSGLKRAWLVGQLRRRQTLLPPTMTLAVTLGAAAIGWFALDRRSLLRDNALGLALPAGLAAASLFFFAIGLSFAFRIRTLRRLLEVQPTPRD